MSNKKNCSIDSDDYLRSTQEITYTPDPNKLFVPKNNSDSHKKCVSNNVINNSGVNNIRNQIPRSRNTHENASSTSLLTINNNNPNITHPVRQPSVALNSYPTNNLNPGTLNGLNSANLFQESLNPSPNHTIRIPQHQQLIARSGASISTPSSTPIMSELRELLEFTNCHNPSTTASSINNVPNLTNSSSNGITIPMVDMPNYNRPILASPNDNSTGSYYGNNNYVHSNQIRFNGTVNYNRRHQPSGVSLMQDNHQIQSHQQQTYNVVNPTQNRFQTNVHNQSPPCVQNQSPPCVQNHSPPFVQNMSPSCVQNQNPACLLPNAIYMNQPRLTCSSQPTFYSPLSQMPTNNHIVNNNNIAQHNRSQQQFRPNAPIRPAIIRPGILLGQRQQANTTFQDKSIQTDHSTNDEPVHTVDRATSPIRFEVVRRKTTAKRPRLELIRPSSDSDSDFELSD